MILMTRRSVYLVGALFLALTSVFQTGCAWISGPALYRQISQADRRFQEQRYGLAAVGYQRALDWPRDFADRQRVLLQMGRCFYNEQIQSLHDAQAAYTSYLAQYPRGTYSDEARLNLERIQAIIYNRQLSIKARETETVKTVEGLRLQIQQRPYDADLHFALGNALWEMKRYDEACGAYLKSIEINAWLREHDLIKARLSTNEKGEVVPVTPALQMQIERERNPLVISDLHDFRSRPILEYYSASEAFYNVTGMVRNQSSRYLRGVVVEVRFYNASRSILGVERAQVGNCPPGAMRGFSVRASSADNIYNISSYECLAYED
jgi:tetratricopeptide (TPR) repeat protein